MYLLTVLSEYINSCHRTLQRLLSMTDRANQKGHILSNFMYYKGEVPIIYYSFIIMQLPQGKTKKNSR